MNCALGNCTAYCTDLGSVLCKNLGILTSKQLSRITNLYFNGTNSSTFSTGNAPKKLDYGSVLYGRPYSVVSHLDMYRTNVLMYRTMVLLARPAKGQMLDV
jgi:hypothetical protein